MVEGRRKDWRELESMEDAARRLLQELDERTQRKATERKTLAGGVRLGPAEIRDPDVSPSGKAADSESAGWGSLDRCPPVTQPREEGCDHVAGSDVCSNGLVAGGVSGLLRARIDFPMRPPAQPYAGPNGEGFTVEAPVEERAWNARTGKSD